MAVIAVVACGQRPPADAIAHADRAESNEAVIRRYVEAINTHDYEGLRDVLAPDFKLQLGSDALDREQVVAIAQSTVASFPDSNHTIEICSRAAIVSSFVRPIVARTSRILRRRRHRSKSR